MIPNRNRVWRKRRRIALSLLLDKEETQQASSSTTVLTPLRNFCRCSVAQSCPTLCDPMDCSPPGSSVPGTLQARVLEWVACSPPGDLPNPAIEPMTPALQVDSLPLSRQGSPLSGMGRGFMSSSRSSTFFFCKVSKRPYLASGNSVTGSGSPKLCAPDVHLKHRLLQKSTGGEERQMQRITQMKSEVINFV